MIGCVRVGVGRDGCGRGAGYAVCGQVVWGIVMMRGMENGGG